MVAYFGFSHGFSIPQTILTEPSSVDQSLCISNEFDWFPYTIIPQNIYASVEVTAFLSNTSEIIDTEDGHVDNIHQQTTMEDYSEIIQSFLPTQFHKLVAYAKLFDLVGEFMIWCGNVVREIESNGTQAIPPLYFNRSYQSDQLYEYGFAGILAYPAYRGGDFKMAAMYLHFIDVHIINMNLIVAVENQTYRFDDFIFNLTHLIMCEQLAPQSLNANNSVSCKQTNPLMYIANRFDQSFNDLQEEYALTISPGFRDMFFSLLEMTDPMRFVRSISYLVAKFEELTPVIETAVTANCQNHIFGLYSTCTTCQDVIGNASSLTIAPLITTLDDELQLYFQVLQNTSIELQEMFILLNNSINNENISTTISQDTTLSDHDSK